MHPAVQATLLLDLNAVTPSADLAGMTKLARIPTFHSAPFGFLRDIGAGYRAAGQATKYERALKGFRAAGSKVKKLEQAPGVAPSRWHPLQRRGYNKAQKSFAKNQQALIDNAPSARPAQPATFGGDVGAAAGAFRHAPIAQRFFSKPSLFGSGLVAGGYFGDKHGQRSGAEQATARALFEMERAPRASALLDLLPDFGQRKNRTQALLALMQQDKKKKSWLQQMADLDYDRVDSLIQGLRQAPPERTHGASDIIKAMFAQ